MAFEDHVKKLIAEYLKISRNEILTVELLNAVGYSDDVFEEVNSFISSNDLEGLKNESLDRSDNQDNLFICRVTVFGKKYLALILDPLELYDNTRILKLIDLDNNLITQ
jgi:hypothetical protein